MAYTREELTVHTDGLGALVQAVIKQWHKDGEPVGDKDTVDLWSNVLQSHIEDMQEPKSGFLHRGELHEPSRKN